MNFDRDKWQREYEYNLDKADRKQIAKVKSFYKKEFNKGVEIFLSDKPNSFSLLFPEDKLLKIYRDMYSETGLQIAKWYSSNFKKFIKKSISGSQMDVWQNSFASFGSAMGAQRVTLVKGTALKSLQDITSRLMKDPEFMNMGTAGQARILSSQFSLYSQNLAERLVRTETTAAAAFAQKEAANTIFPGVQKVKQWVASFDDRTRDAHAEVDGQIVDENKPFVVGGTFMQFPGDPAGGAANVINCRCSHFYLPKQNAVAAGGIENISFGLGGAASTGFGLGNFAGQIGASIVGGVQAATDAAIDSINKFKSAVKDLFEQNGFNISKVGVSRSLSIGEYNERMKVLEELFSKYGYALSRDNQKSIRLLFQSKGSYNGRIQHSRNGRLFEVNLGSQSNLRSRTRSIYLDKFDNRFSSAVDAGNAKFATLVHEMGHTLTTSDLKSHHLFWDKIRVYRGQYRSELREYGRLKDYKNYNSIYLGRYSQTNVDEFFAEAFTEYQLSSDPSKFARLVGELTDETFKL